MYSSPNDRGQYEKGHADGKAEATPRWIPVTERLPEHHSDVLVLDACGCDVAWLMDDGKWSTTLISDYPVSHWMPLPEPPKEVNPLRNVTEHKEE